MGTAENPGMNSDVYSLAATAYHLLTDDDPRDHPGQYPQLQELPPALVRSGPLPSSSLFPQAQGGPEHLCEDDGLPEVLR